MEDVEIIKPSLRLKQKVGAGNGATFSAKTVERAEKSIVAMSNDYVQKASVEISSLRALAQQALKQEANASAILGQISKQAREIKGQGSTFGFPLLTRISDSLYQFTDGMSVLNQKRMGVIIAHLDAMQLVISQKIKGDGGNLGNELCRSLDEAIAKFGGE